MKRHYHFDPTYVMFDINRFLQARYQTDVKKAVRLLEKAFI